MSFAIFNEEYYLRNYPDVAAAVQARVFTSGRQHFELVGITEGRVLISPSFDETTYLAKYQDVAAAVQTGQFSSGLEHFIRFGEAEGRSGLASGGPDPLAFFNEKAYLINNIDVSAAIRFGFFKSGLEHYQKAGQFEGRTGFFNGSAASDVITSFGGNTQIYGVGITTAVEDIFGDTYDVRTTSVGNNEIDTLVGGGGQDEFVLGTGRIQTIGIQSGFQSFYLNTKDFGSDDYALIRNFEKGKDTIVLGGTPNQFVLVPNGFGGNYLIYTASNAAFGRPNDLVAIVEGSPNLAIQNPDDALKSGLTILG